MIFGVWNTEKILRQQLVYLPTSPVSCSDCTLRNHNVIFQHDMILIIRIISG